jgi:hypothetical protein
LFQLETCWWVPLLFGGAAVILGIGHPTLDAIGYGTKGPSSGNRIKSLEMGGVNWMEHDCKDSSDHLSRALLPKTPELQNSKTDDASRDSLPTAFIKEEPSGGYAPSWLFVLASIALFAVQYDLSGLLAEKATNGQLSWLTVNVVLAGTAIAHWGTFDRTRNGLFWAALTAVVGPLVEIGLIDGLHLYQYTHPDVFSIPIWIP